MPPTGYKSPVVIGTQCKRCGRDGIPTRFLSASQVIAHWRRAAGSCD